jgi:hypothetical protein
MTADMTQPHRLFLDCLFQDGDGFIELRAIVPGRPPHRLFTRPGQWPAISDFLVTWRDQADVYVGIAARKSEGSGKLDNCGSLRALWIDLDFTRITPADAARRLSEFPLAPALVIGSGGGLHVYWLLTDALDVQQDEAVIREALERLALKFDADPSSAEPARVLRVPETWNHKYQPNRPVTLDIYEPNRSVLLDDLFQFLPPLPEKPASGTLYQLPDILTVNTRHDHLWRLARSSKARGVSAPEVRALLEAVNRERCQPPHDAQELDRIVRQAFEQPDRPRADAGPPDRTDEEARAVAPTVGDLDGDPGQEILGPPASWRFNVRRCVTGPALAPDLVWISSRFRRRPRGGRGPLARLESGKLFGRLAQHGLVLDRIPLVGRVRLVPDHGLRGRARDTRALQVSDRCPPEIVRGWPARSDSRWRVAGGVGGSVSGLGHGDSPLCDASCARPPQVWRTTKLTCPAPLR